MTNSNEWLGKLEINDSKQAESLVAQLNEEQKALLVDALNKKTCVKQATKEKKEGSYENVIDKINPTAKDKINMEKSIKFLIDNKMNTEENLKKLEAINYGPNYIEIWWIKRARENLKAEPNGKDIFQHWDEIYFGFHQMVEQMNLLNEKWMDLPDKKQFIKTLKALPWERWEHGPDEYVWGNILWIILDLPKSGSQYRNKLFDQGVSGYIWSTSGPRLGRAWIYEFNEDKGGLAENDMWEEYPIRPILK